ncbi:TPA: Ig domain-containing protein [Klebsiella pneumoniae]|nr:Ig domain-containing protein [Klebsiella pneumoniae]ELP0880801.1 Ig domain-containing protein [Klebsiella pneumoniae]HBT4797397.1 Ig domain-containing protein [Klebsiella pneumoniae]HDY9164338.1 Ig domain-containing protein [Klebsiella pneumoniae]
MSEQKMKITDEQFSDFTGTMFNTPFTKSVSDVPMTDYRQNRLKACFKSEPHEDVAPVIHVQSVSVSPEKAAVDVGASVQLSGVIKPDNATDSSSHWASADTSVATVDSSGLVKGVAAGSVKILLVATDGSVTGESVITVNEPASAVV